MELILVDKNYSSIPETFEHVEHVKNAIGLICEELKHRGVVHDMSKMEPPELEYFDKYTPLLKKMEYGSDEYKKSLDELKPALEHHYKNNPHHPEHHEQGLMGMNLIDLIEMFCDWYAASKRTKNGNMENSINVSCKRFNVSEQLKKIFMNSIELLNNEKT